MNNTLGALSREGLYLTSEPTPTQTEPAAQQAAVKTLQGLGYVWHGAEEWEPPLGKRPRFISEGALLEAENEALRRALDVRRWDQSMHDAWHQAIPDVHKAFADLLSAALAQYPKAGDAVTPGGMVMVPRADLERIANCSDLEMGDGDMPRAWAKDVLAAAPIPSPAAAEGKP